jgi:hypothetical protein
VTTQLAAKNKKNTENDRSISSFSRRGTHQARHLLLRIRRFLRPPLLQSAGEVELWDLLHKLFDLDPALLAEAIIRVACCKDAINLEAARDVRAGEGVAQLLAV